jgi:putative transposase
MHLSKTQKIATLCQIANKSRQAYYKARTSHQDRHSQEQEILTKVQYLRRLHPKIGVRKLHYVLSTFHQIEIGRDKLFSLLRNHNLLVKRKRRVRYIPAKNTVRAGNKLKDVVIAAPGQVMMSDITYLKSKTRDYYLALVVDGYSRKIIGYNLSDSLCAIHAIRALQQAIEQSDYRYAVHHSDGGTQYTCHDYQQYLAKHNILPSMTRPGSPQDNPIVERINGILKHEYGLKEQFASYEEMLAKTNLAISIYNNIRPHWALKLNIPNIVHQKNLSTYFRT